ncbi:MAG: YciI family protein [Acidobacteriota bacterium]
MDGFIFLFRGGLLHEVDDVSPEEMQQHMDKWQAWIADMTRKEIFLGGEPLHVEGGRVVTRGGVVSDGPFPEAKEMVAGYVAIRVDTMEEACEVAKGCPIYDYDGRVEVHKILAEHSDAVDEAVAQELAAS